MERPKRPYSIQKRPAVKHRHIYYAKFRDAAGNYCTAVSTGCTRIDDAVRWCEARLRKMSRGDGQRHPGGICPGFLGAHGCVRDGPRGARPGGFA